MREKKRDREQLGTSYRLHPRFPGIRLGKKKKCEIVRDSKAELSSSIHMYFGVSVNLQHVETLISDW